MMEKDVLCECQPREIEPHSTFVSSTLSVYFAFNLQFGKKDNKKNLLLLVIFEEKKKVVRYPANSMTRTVI